MEKKRSSSGEGYEDNQGLSTALKDRNYFMVRRSAALHTEGCCNTQSVNEWRVKHRIMNLSEGISIS